MNLDEVKTLTRGQRLVWTEDARSRFASAYGETVTFLQFLQENDHPRQPTIEIETTKGVVELSPGWLTKSVSNCTETVVHQPVTATVKDEETGTEFERTTCANCGRWLGGKASYSLTIK